MQLGTVPQGCDLSSTRTVKPKRSQEKGQGGSKVEELMVLNRLGHVSPRLHKEGKGVHVLRKYYKFTSDMRKIKRDESYP